ncbi:MAG: 50S ribosomal protein L25/general stress protein Ctc [Prolixibacteraceae bacterium]|nr:50S ribosomal protein L25/general stress protein Ctc [Prolixibacteraceae bacterium]
MKTYDVNGKLREATGKKDSKKLRSENNVPCVLYGLENPIHFYVPKNDLLKLIFTPSVYLINLDIDGDKHQAIMQDLQFDPVTDEVIHIDFLKVYDDKLVKVDIPVVTKGFAKGIRKGGKLQVEMRRLKILALPKDLPDVITIDVSDIDIGQSLRVGDIDLENVTILNHKSVPVIRIMVTRAARAASQSSGDTHADEDSSENSKEE